MLVSPEYSAHFEPHSIRFFEYTITFITFIVLSGLQVQRMDIDSHKSLIKMAERG